MPFAIYTATESIAPGHVANVQYSIAFSVQRADLGNEILKAEQRSMSGVKETLHFGKISRWSIVLEPVAAELLPYYLEFLDSTADGQSFTFDPYGKELAPLKAMTVEREDKGYSLRRFTLTGDPMYSDLHEFSFEVSEVA
jgi:hypothetical protein